MEVLIEIDEFVFEKEKFRKNNKKKLRSFVVGKSNLD
jgi:hypothetical protein